MLGDNIFYGPGLGTQLQRFNDVDGGAVFAYWVAEPERVRGGRVRRSGQGDLAGGEAGRSRSPTTPCPGLYFYDNDVVEIARGLKPSPRGEYEITDVNRHYLEAGRLQRRGAAPGHRLAGHRDVRLAQRRQQLRPHAGGPAGPARSGAPEEAAWRQGFLSDAELEQRARCPGQVGLRGVPARPAPPAPAPLNVRSWWHRRLRPVALDREDFLTAIGADPGAKGRADTWSTAAGPLTRPATLVPLRAFHPQPACRRSP